MNRQPQPDGPTFPELLAGYADGELDSAGRLRVEAWLAENPQAAAELDAQRRLGRRHNRLWANSAAPLPGEASWSMMALRVRSAIEMAPKPAAAPRQSPNSRRRLLMAAAAFAAAVLLAVAVFRPSGSGTPSDARDEALVIASDQDVEIMRILEVDVDRIVVGELPIHGMIVLASIDDIEGLKVVKDTDGMMPMIQMQAGPNAPMIVVPMAGK